MTLPANLAPPGVKLPPGVPLVYDVELTEVNSSSHHCSAGFHLPCFS